MINRSDIYGDDSDKSISESDSSENSIDEEKLGLHGAMPTEGDDDDLTEEERRHLSRAMKDFRRRS